MKQNLFKKGKGGVQPLKSAPRMEGVVRNLGIKAVKKPKKEE